MTELSLSHEQLVKLIRRLIIETIQTNEDIEKFIHDKVWEAINENEDSKTPLAPCEIEEDRGRKK